MASFEAMLVRCLNEFYNKKKIAAMAYRLPQVRFRAQGFDVYSDSRHYEYYAAFECKSIEAEKEQMLYFSQYFHHVKGVHQLEAEDDTVIRSGRLSFLAVELKRRRGVRKAAFLVPWKTVMSHYDRGDKGIDQEEITECIELDYHGGDYHITDAIMDEYNKRFCGKPIKHEKINTTVKDWHNRKRAGV